MKTALATIVAGAVLTTPAMAIAPTKIADILADATVEVRATLYRDNGSTTNRTATAFWVSREYLMTAGHTFLNRDLIADDWGDYIFDRGTGLKCAVNFVGDFDGDVQVLQVADMDNCLIPREPMVVYDTDPDIGEAAYTMGYSFGMGEFFSAGHVAGWRGTERIATTVPANPGNSGGAVVNGDGEIIGMTVTIIAHPHARYWGGLTIVLPASELIEAARESGVFEQ